MKAATCKDCAWEHTTELTGCAAYKHLSAQCTNESSLQQRQETEQQMLDYAKTHVPNKYDVMFKTHLVKSFVLKDEEVGGGYYEGKTYISHGETFACYTTKDKAKKYTSRKRVETTWTLLGERTSGVWEIEEIEEEIGD